MSEDKPLAIRLIEEAAVKVELARGELLSFDPAVHEPERVAVVLRTAAAALEHALRLARG